MKQKQNWKAKALSAAIATVMMFNMNVLPLNSARALDAGYSGAPPGVSANVGGNKLNEDKEPPVSLDEIKIPSVGENPYDIEYTIDPYPIYNEEGFQRVSGNDYNVFNLLTEYGTARPAPEGQSSFYSAAITPWFTYETGIRGHEGISGSLPYAEGKENTLYSDLVLTNRIIYVYPGPNSMFSKIEKGSFKDISSSYMEDVHFIDRDQAYLRIGATILSGHGRLAAYANSKWYTVIESTEDGEPLDIMLDIPVTEIDESTVIWIDSDVATEYNDGVMTDIYITLIDNQAPTLQNATLEMVVDEKTDTSQLVVEMEFNEGLRFVNEYHKNKKNDLWIELELLDLSNNSKHKARLYLEKLDKSGRMTFRGDIGYFHYKNFRVNRISGVNLANSNQSVERGLVDLADELCASAYYKIDCDNRIFKEYSLLGLYNNFNTAAIIDHAGNMINADSLVNWQFGKQEFISNSIDAREVRIFNEITLKNSKALAEGGKVEADITDMFAGPSRSLTAYVYLKQKLTGREAAALSISLNILDKNGEPLIAKATSWSEYKIDELYGNKVTTGTLVRFENIKLEEGMRFEEGGDGSTVKITGMYDEIDNKEAYPYLPDPVTVIYADFDAPKVTLEKYASYSNTEESEEGAEIGEHYKVSVKIEVHDDDHLERCAGLIGSKMFVKLGAGVDTDTEVRYVFGSDPEPPKSIDGYTGRAKVSKDGYVDVGSETLLNTSTQRYLHLLFESNDLFLDDVYIDVHVEDAVGNRAKTDPTGTIDYMIDGVAPTITYKYQTAKAIDGNTKIEMKIGIEATDRNDVVQLLYSWGNDPDNWMPAVFERGSVATAEITRVFGSELPKSNTVYEEILRVKSVDEYGNESAIAELPIAISLEKPSTNMRFEGEYNAVDRSNSVIVIGPDKSILGDQDAYTRVSITPIGQSASGAVTSYVTLVKTGEEVDVLKFTGLTWYKVTRMGDLYGSVSEPEYVGEDYVLSRDSIMYDLFTHYGEIKISFENGYADMTPRQGANVSSSASTGSYYDDPNYLTLRFASRFDTERVIHSVDFGAIIDREDVTVVADADKGAEPYLYLADTKCVNPMRNTQIHFNISNVANGGYGMLDLDFESSYAELYRVGENGEDDVLISKVVGLAASDTQYFTIFNTGDDGEYFVSGAYYLKVTVKSGGGHTDVYESSRLVLDAETGETSGAWSYTTQNYNTLSSIISGEYTWSDYSAEDKPFDNIGVSVTVGGEILRNRMFAAYSYGVTALGVTLSVPDSEKTYEGITVGKVAGYRMWNLLCEPTDEEIEAEGFNIESGGVYMGPINGLGEIYTEENIPKGKDGFDEMYLVKGVNTICYQILMENGYVSPIRQFNVTVSEYTPELNMAIEEYQPSSKQSNIPEVINVDHIRYFVESAYSLNGSGEVEVEVWSDYGMYVGINNGEETVRSYVGNPSEGYLGELGRLDIPGGVLKVGDYVELTENSYTSDFPEYTVHCSAVFVARDEYGGVTIVAPQIGNNRRVENRGDVYGYEVYNIDYYTDYYDDPYLIEDNFLSWRKFYNQPLYFGNQFLGFDSYIEKNTEAGGEKYAQITNGSASLEYNLFNIETNDIKWGRGESYVSSVYSYASYSGGLNYDLIYWDGATITFTGGDLGDESVTLDLKTGDMITAVETEEGIVQDAQPNKIGYMGASVFVDNWGDARFSFDVAHPRATEDNPAGTETVRQYTIRCFSRYGDYYELEGEIALEYLDYSVSCSMTEYGAQLDLSFISREYYTNYLTGYFNKGDYTFTTVDYYGNTVELPYEITADHDSGTEITLSKIENTFGPVTVTLNRGDGKKIYVDIIDHAIMTVENNGTASVTVILSDSTAFSYRYIDDEGNEIETIIKVENIKKPNPKVVWSYDEKTLLEDENGNYYRYGEVTAYLVDEHYSLIDKFSGRAPSFTFTPEGQDSYIFKGEEIKAILGDEEIELNGDFLALLSIKLYTMPDPLGFDIEDAESPNVQVLAYVDQNGYYSNSCLALRLESAKNTSFLPKYSNYTTYEFAGDRANAAKLLSAVGWGTSFRFEIQTEDRSRVKIFIKEGLYAEAPDYETGFSDFIPGVEVNSKLITVTQNASFSLFVVDAHNNAASIAFDINNIGEAPVPDVVKVEKGLGTIRGYLIPPDGATNFEIIGTQNVKVDADSPTDSKYFGKYYVEYTENDDYIVNYRFTYNEKTVNGQIRVSVTEISLDEIALTDANQPVWSDNKSYEATATDITATATFNKEIAEIKIAGDYDKEKVSFTVSGNMLTVTYSDNHKAIEIYCYDAAGNHATVRFDAVENIDKTAPVIELVDKVLSANGRSLLVTLSSNERALFKEGGYIGETVTDEDGNTLYYYTRTIVQNGTYTYSFVDMSGITAQFTITVDEIVSEPLAVQYSTSQDGNNPCDDPSALDVMIGDKIFINPNRDSTVELSGGAVYEIKKGIWNELVIPESVGGILPYVIITDAYGNVLTHQFSMIKVPDTTPPEIIVERTTYSVRVGTTKEQIEAELLENFVAFDDMGGEVTRSVRFTENIDVIGVTEVEYIATDSEGNSTTVKEKLRITSIYEPVVKYGEIKLHRGDGAIVAADEELVLNIDCNGAPYTVRIKSGNRTEAQMKDGSDIVTNYTTENNISFGKLAKGIYTICVISQERDYFKIIISVE